MKRITITIEDIKDKNLVETIREEAKNNHLNMAEVWRGCDRLATCISKEQLFLKLFELSKGWNITGIKTILTFDLDWVLIIDVEPIANGEESNITKEVVEEFLWIDFKPATLQI